MDLITLALAKKYTDEKQEEAMSSEIIKQAVDEYMAENPETDPTVPTWAKQPEKPKYTAAEVGALPADTVIPDAGIPIPPSAQVGQTIVVKAVDENGKPTEWEAADLPSGGGEVWEDISSGELTEEVSSIVIDKDSDGNDFNLIKGRLYLEVVGASTNTVDRGELKFSHNYRGTGGGTVQMGTLTRVGSHITEFAMGDYDFSLDGRGVVSYIATQATDKKAFMYIPLTKIYIDGITENATMMGIGTRWLLRGVRK